MPTKVNSNRNTPEQITVKNVFTIYAILLIIWGFYRVLFQLPETVEEVILKPLIWLGSLFYFLHKEKKGLSSVGWVGKSLFRGAYFGLGLGAVFAFIAIGSNALKYGGLHLAPNILQGQNLLLGLSLSLITAISEETVFRGYIFNRLEIFLKDTFIANILTSIGWAVIHLPVMVLVYHLDSQGLIVQLFLSFIYSLGAGFIFSKTKNILAPILVSVLWAWPIILFR